MNNDVHRFFFIELLCYWERSINSTSISKQFGISSTQSLSILKTYREKYQSNGLEYNSSEKAFKPTIKFNTSFINCGIEQYLSWLTSGQLGQSGSDFVSYTRLPERQVHPNTVRAIIAALKKPAQRVDVDYRSVSNPSSDGRIIVPHSLVFTCGRWHLRAFCEKSQDYRDFVLSRFVGDSEIIGESDKTVETDSDWNTFVELRLSADTRLTKESRAIIEHDYDMIDGLKKLKVRGCLVQYWLQEFKISPNYIALDPTAQQLICVNLSELTPWLFAS